jgi:hypothetical protein
MSGFVLDLLNRLDRLEHDGNLSLTTRAAPTGTSSGATQPIYRVK